MTAKPAAVLALLALSFAVQSACAAAALSSTAAPGPEVVHVAPPTGEREADRASILAALQQVRSGGTVQFAAGTYLVGEIIPLALPRISLLGHPEGTTLRGCDAEAYEELARRAYRATDYSEHWAAVSRCGTFELTGGHGTVRALTFEYTMLSLVLGCCYADGTFRPSDGGYRIEGNTFRNSTNGVRPLLTSPAATVIRANTFINTFHAVSSGGSHVHVLDNDISVPEPGRLPDGYPGFAVGFFPIVPPSGDMPAASVSACEHNVVAGNRIDGHDTGVVLFSDPGTSCRYNAIRDNTIIVRRIRLPASRPFPEMIDVTDEADSTVVGVPVTLHNPTGEGVLEHNLIERNRVIGAEGIGIEILHASRNRIVDNMITAIRWRHPFPGNTLGGNPQRWHQANGSGIWVSFGSEENEIRGNTFTDIASHAVVLEGDGNHVETRSASDAVHDLGAGNRVRAPGVAGDSAAPSGSAAGRRPVREGYAPAADGVRLFYRVEGQGPDTVIVLHGGPSLGFAYLAPDLEPLGREYTLLYYDQRGIGRSTPPAEGADLTIARHVADLEALRRHFGLGRLALVGHSWGGMLAARYAAAYPEHVERMLLIDPMVPARSPYMAQAGARAQQLMRERLDSLQLARLDSLGRSWAETEDPVSHCRTTYGLVIRVAFQAPDGAGMTRGDFCADPAEVLRSRPQVDEAIMGSLEDWDVRPLLAAVTVPVLIVHGSASAIPAEAMQEWARVFANARLMVVPDAGHYLYVDRPDVFFPAAAGFLGGR